MKTPSFFDPFVHNKHNYFNVIKINTRIWSMFENKQRCRNKTAHTKKKGKEQEHNLWNAVSLTKGLKQDKKKTTLTANTKIHQQKFKWRRKENNKEN